jgi:hypothetical protein
MDPVTFALPVVGGSTCARIFRRVDLPAPFLPMIAITSPESTVNSLKRDR